MPDSGMPQAAGESHGTCLAVESAEVEPLYTCSHCSTSVQRMGTVRHGAPSPECGRDEGCFGELLFGRAGLFGLLGVNFDAVGTLGRQCDRDGHELFVLDRDGPF